MFVAILTIGLYPNRSTERNCLEQVPLQDACNRCRHQWMCEALEVWKKRLEMGSDTEVDGLSPCQAAAAGQSTSSVRIAAST